MPKGRIKINKATKGHKSTLEHFGYEVVETEFDGSPCFEVTCEGFEEDVVDMTNSEVATAKMREMAAQKRLFTYRTKFRLTDVESGKVEEHSNRWAIQRLPLVVTAFIAKPIKVKVKKAKPASGLDISLQDLGDPEA